MRPVACGAPWLHADCRRCLLNLLCEASPLNLSKQYLPGKKKLYVTVDCLPPLGWLKTWMVRRRACFQKYSIRTLVISWLFSQRRIVLWRLTMHRAVLQNVGNEGF
uniref:Uncharacterized protein n=1 Tax=Arundo donax TaxID=35708 RepID=A0A0A8ZTW7_ARUDO